MEDHEPSDRIPYETEDGVVTAVDLDGTVHRAHRPDEDLPTFGSVPLPRPRNANYLERPRDPGGARSEVHDG